jgi:hypothetical protein
MRRAPALNNPRLDLRKVQRWNLHRSRIADYEGARLLAESLESGHYPIF